jgi:UDP-3-O-[3-hydroxymyristoyl] glucosamine N-acyltransferase
MKETTSGLTLVMVLILSGSSKMKLAAPTALGDISKLIGAKAVGDLNLKVTGINEIHVVEVGDIAFVDHPKYYDKTLGSQASVVIIDREVTCPNGKGLLIHPAPFDAFNELTQHFQRERERLLEPQPKVHPDAHVKPGAILGKYVQVGAGSVIHPGVVVYDHCIIGERVTIHANSVIGSDAFYFKRKQSHHEKLRSVGRVILEDDVEIGAACTIDRGSTGDTIIGSGSKLDNQVHIGHDTKVGRQCLMAAQVGIAGCVSIGDRVVMWGQVGCAANVHIGEGSVIYAQSGIAKSIEAGQTYFGSPAVEARTKMREIAAVAQLVRKT